MDLILSILTSSSIPRHFGSLAFLYLHLLQGDVDLNDDGLHHGDVKHHEVKQHTTPKPSVFLSLNYCNFAPVRFDSFRPYTFNGTSPPTSPPPWRSYTAWQWHAPYQPRTPRPPLLPIKWTIISLCFGQLKWFCKKCFIANWINCGWKNGTLIAKSLGSVNSGLERNPSAWKYLASPLGHGQPVRYNSKVTREREKTLQ